MAKKVIAVANQKGGVGKTTTVVNVAVNLIKKGYKVLCIDLDGQGNLSDYLGYEADENDIVITDLIKAEMSNALTDDVIVNAIKTSDNDGIEYIASDISLATADMFLITAMGREYMLSRVLAHKIFDDYDYILIDCLPSLNVLVINALVACDGVIIPVQTEKFALNGIIQFEDIIRMAQSLKPSLDIIGVVETMCNNTNISKAVDEALRERYGNKVFASKINRSIQASNSTVEQKAMDERTKLGTQYASLTDEIVARVG